jgi:uncharacterized membrane-anchored protein
MSINQQHPSQERTGHRTCDTSRPSEIGSSKIPEVTLTFWVIKILATTLGETGGDAVSMSLNLGYVISLIIFICVFLCILAALVRD